MSNDPHDKRAQQGRVAGLVIAFTGALWVGATWAGAHFDWSVRTRALFDLLALAGFAWALIATYQIWRSRQDDEG